MTTLFLKLVSILWSNRAIIAAAIPLVIQAQKEFARGSDKKKWVTDQLERVKQFTPQVIDDGIEAAVYLMKLGGLL